VSGQAPAGEGPVAPATFRAFGRCCWCGPEQENQDFGQILDAWFAGEPSSDEDDAANVRHLSEIEP